MKILLFFISIFIFFSCNSKQNEIKAIDLSKNQDSIKYAKLFKINRFAGYVELVVLSKDSKQSSSYYLIKKGNKVPEILKDKSVIFTPVERVICMSTTHIAFFEVLNKIEHIVGVSGAYVYNKKVVDALKNGKILDAGYEQAPDYENIIRSKPDLLTIYNIDGNNSSVLNKLKALKIPVVSINEYSEPDILGQTEWIKFFAEFVGETQIAEQIFDSISNNYENLKKTTQNISPKPDVLLNMPWKGVWYMPGNKSNIAQIINDAGGNYFWKENSSERNYPTDIANVFLNARESDIWLNPGQAQTYSDIENIDYRLTKFSAYKNKKIFNRNKRMSETGGNDFMESGVVHPDIILRDIIKILHPELMPSHEFYYYKSLN